MKKIFYSGLNATDGAVKLDQTSKMLVLNGSVIDPDKISNNDDNKYTGKGPAYQVNLEIMKDYCLKR